MYIKEMGICECIYTELYLCVYTDVLYRCVYICTNSHKIGWLGQRVHL